MLLYQRKCTIKLISILAHKTHERSANKVWTEGVGVVARHGKTGREAFLSMSVGLLHHFLLFTTASLPKNIVRKEQSFVWGEGLETFF